MAQKYAIVVGCNYPNTESELRGCINDAKSIHNILIKRFHLKETNVKFLTDNPGSGNMPTAYNIKTVLKRFISDAKSGDVVLFFYAGHGTIIPGSYSASGKDEQAIMPCDFNPITCMDFRALLIGAPDGVTFVLMSDSCHSGGLIDQVKEQIGPHHDPDRQVVSTNQFIRMIPFEVVLQQLSLQSPVNDAINVPTHFMELFGLDASLAFHAIPHDQFVRRLKPEQGILLSGCQPNESSYETVFDDDLYHGYFTRAVLNVLKEQPDPITNWKLGLQARRIVVRERSGKQHPCLYCTDENAGAFFLHERV